MFVTLDWCVCVVARTTRKKAVEGGRLPIDMDEALESDNHDDDDKRDVD